MCPDFGHSLQSAAVFGGGAGDIAGGQETSLIDEVRDASW